jgi:multidrug efflux pump subunit AcrB
MARGSADMTGGILSYFVRHRTAANLLLVVMIAAGIAAFPRMRTQFFPDIVLGSMSVSVNWKGAGAEDVDRAIVQLLEPALLAVEGVESSSTTSSEGRAVIGLEFEPDWDMSRAVDDVQAVVDTMTNLPEDADEPVVRQGAFRDRVTDVVITGPVGIDQLARFADELVTRLFAEGVTRTTISGVAAPATIVEVPSLALRENDITMAEIGRAIAREAATDPAGDVGGGAARIRTGVAKHSASDIASIVLRSDATGSKLTIGDVARVRVEGIDRARAYFVGDNPAIQVRVDRSERGDAITLQGKVEKVVQDLKLSLPESVTLDLIRTRSEAITNRLNLLLDNGLVGLGLVVLLLFLFLNARTALWVAAGIPVSVTAAIAMMYLAGITFNMISLFALIITLGIVVDDAIVVGEHADFRVRRLGETPIEAAENAARRMFSPVFAATITTIIAFFGLVIIGGRFGSLIADIPFTVVVVLTASLIECFLILPNHMSHALAHAAKSHWYDWPSRIVNVGFGWFRDRVFRPLMGLAIWARYPLIALTIVVLISQISIFVRGDLQFRFFNAPERGSISGNFAMASGATRRDSLAMMKELQRATEEVGAAYEAEYGTNPISYVVTQIGGGAGRGLSGVDNKETWQLGAISIELIDADLRPYSSYAVVARLQDVVRQHPLAETVSFRGARSGPGGEALDVELFGADATTLKRAAEALKAALAQFPEVSGLEDSLAYDKDELVLELTPQGQALGLTIDGLGRVLRDRLNGLEAATYPDGARSAAIRVELPARELTADFLDRTQVRTTTGNYVNLVDIVTVQRRSGFSTVQRQNGVRLVSVTGDLSEDDPARASEIMTRLREQILPGIETTHGVAWRLAGLAEQESAFLNDALVGFVLCLIGIYLALSWIFSSWKRPIVVMVIIPFGLVGAIYGHVAWGVPLSMFSVVGLIGMTGIIINDSIVLVTTIDEYAAQRGIIPAIIDGACDRLRPVLLTTATTVLGLAPLLFETSRDAQFLKPTVITLVYGLGFGMVLVLLLVPAVLAVQQDFSRQLLSLRRAVARPRKSPLVAGLTILAAVAIATLFWATLGSVMTTGAIWPGLGRYLSFPAHGMGMAFALFAAGAAVLLAVFFLLVATGIALFRRS